MTADGPDHLTLIEEAKKALASAKGVEKARLYAHMGDSYLALDKAHKAAVCYRYAHEGGLEDLDFLDRFALSLARSGRTDEAEAMLEELIGPDLKVEERARVLVRQAFIQNIKSEYAKAKKNCDIAIALLGNMEKGEDEERIRVQAEANNIIGLALWRQAMLQGSLSYLQKGLSLYRSIDDEQGISDILNNMGNVHYHLGQFDRALEYYEESQEVKERISYYNNRALIMMARGRFDEAEDLFKTCIRRSLNMGRIDVIPVAQLNLADLCLEKGDLKKARGWLDQAGKSISELDHETRFGDLMEARAKVSLEEGDLDGAEKATNEAMAHAKKDRRRLLEASVPVIQGRIAMARGQNRSAKRLISSGIDKLRKLGAEYELAKALVDYALFLKGTGEEEEMGRTAAEARAMFERLGFQYHLGKMDRLGL